MFAAFKIIATFLLACVSVVAAIVESGHPLLFRLPVCGLRWSACSAPRLSACTGTTPSVLRLTSPSPRPRSHAASETLVSRGLRWMTAIPTMYAPPASAKMG